MALTPQQATGKKLGSFELVKEVSASSVGATFVARTASGDSVILTKIHRHVAKSPQLCDAFLNETKKAARLSHPNLARVLESGTIDGEPFVTHEHHEGDSLAAVLRRAGPDGLPLPVAARIVGDLIAAIQAAHQTDSSLGHGELGPWCVHIGQDGRSRISGFAVDRSLTRFGLHFAKNLDRLPYAAPERVKAMSLTLGPAPAPPDLHADTFSAVLIAWELFTRQRLFASRMEAAVIQKVLAGAIPEPSSQRAEISPELSAAISLALLRDVTSRGSLAQVAAAIESGEVAGYEEVADVISRQVGRSQTRPVTNTSTTAFASVRPPAGLASQGVASLAGPTSVRPPSPLEVPANGRTNHEISSFGQSLTAERPRTAPPPPPARAVKSRAKTLMGFSPIAAGAMPIKPEVKAEELIEEETIEVPTVEIPKPPSNGSLAALAQAAIADEATSVDSDFLIEVDEPAPAPAKPPARRPPPKPRQHTLMGIEPVASVVAAALVLDETPAPPVASPRPVASPKPATAQELLAREAPTKVDPDRGEPGRPSHSPKQVVSVYGLERLGPGALVGNPPTIYELLAAVARGGMATVWAARAKGARGIDSLFGVKTMLPELSDDPDFESMFLDEMRVTTRIQHENVARIHSVGGSDGVLYIAMEWVDGENLFALQQAARSSGGVPLNVLVRMAEDICAGLHAAHELTDDAGALLDLVHRDVTPANVIVNRKGVVKVVDFGIAKSKGRVHVTRAGSTVKGKTPYLSPEQLGGLTIDRRSDLFSLGALLYVMATGVHPFRGESELKTIENIVLKVPAPLRTLVPDIHPEFEKLVLRLLEKDPKKRPASAAETAKELGRIENLLEKSASHADVAIFVERVVGEVLAARDRELIQALREFDPRDPAVLAEAKHQQNGQPVGMQPVAPPPSLSPAAQPSAQSLAFDEETVRTEAIVDAAVEPPPFDIPAFDPAPIAEAKPVAAVPSSAAAAARAIVDSTPERAPASDADPLLQRKPISPWLRLVLLVVVGVVVGIGVIALIEALRNPQDATPPPSGAKPTATQAALPVTATAVPTVPATPTVEAQPTVTATATGTATAEATVRPTAEPTQTTPPTAPKTATVKPPTTAVVRPPTTSTVKKPPIKKHNPTGI